MEALGEATTDDYRGSVPHNVCCLVFLFTPIMLSGARAIWCNVKNIIDMKSTIKYGFFVMQYEYLLGTLFFVVF